MTKEIADSVQNNHSPANEEQSAVAVSFGHPPVIAYEMKYHSPVISLQGFGYHGRHPLRQSYRFLFSSITLDDRLERADYAVTKRWSIER